ncbi:helix-turn-helix transcriptional regulator [Clostridium sporogenes]|nr:helix-turn-helix transcriptional regulator [Clostridium sporogenes]NFS24799.1 helix-turn-helix transcriptional regulator [Clostridium sporogenes]
MLKAVRKLKDIKQKYLANRLGVSQSYLSKLENYSLYEVTVTIDTIKSLAMELNICSIAVFLYFLNVKFFCRFDFKKHIK